MPGPPVVATPPSGDSAMRFITFPEILTLPTRPAEPGPCQARLPNGRHCRRPASRASGYHKCPVHDQDRPVLGAHEITGTGRWAVTTPCGGYTQVTLHPTETAARRGPASLPGVPGGGRWQPAPHRGAQPGSPPRGRPSPPDGPSSAPRPPGPG